MKIFIEEGIIKIKDLGFERFIYIDIIIDGMLKGYNFEVVKYICKFFDGFLIVLGGILLKEDIIRFKSIGVDVVIVGKVFYIG